MEKVLKLYKYINGTTSEAFPSEKEQVIVSSFRYDAKRMGGAPTISCSVMHSSCLDNLWTDNVYASFNGEKYFIKQVPTSSYGNSDTRYKYDIELVSERILLDNVYFYDVVSSSSSDRPVSYSSDFSFFGTISEFVSRLNQSLRYSKLDYNVVVDIGISSEPKLVTFQDQFFSNVLQEIFNTYQLPYYFTGKTIHIGYTNNAITKTLKYGQSESLLSIQKQNANYKIVNRVTGVGSPDNIPYYYPNDYESKSEVEASGGTWINPQHNLMPSIYRDTYGSERFYSAKNNTYISPQTGDYYVFDNPYTGNNPKEHIVNFENIKPTIEGIKNGSGYRIDMFREFAYDLDDNDETDEEGNYKHPYFFAKLRYFDGELGFNLFDHAIDEEEMVISMTSGSCGACEFIIGVDENTNKNIVQVDENGNLLRDENGNVKFGAPQDRQNDTINNEVWIALKKDIDTFGIIMPNASSNYKPSVNDTFVILHIDLPKSYILAAEKRLDEELIKYMAMNNDEKFNFSIEFSRIFFAENPSILDQFDENARIQIEYDGNRYELYVSSFSYAMNDNAPLPEVRVELSDTLTISQNALQSAIDEVKLDIMSSVGSVDFLKQGLRYFLRKDKDDRSKGIIASDKGLEVGTFESGTLGTGAAMYKDEDGKTYMESDYLTIRKKAMFTTITVKELKHVGGELILSPAAMICSKVEELEDGYKCYFNQKDSDGRKIFNEFEVGDQARCQTFTLEDNTYYWRLVTAIGTDFIVLSKTDCDANSDIPKEGDNISLLGNRTDASRQKAIILSAYGPDAPSYNQYKGINSYSMEDKEVTRLSPNGNRLTGIVNIEAGSTGAQNLSDLPEEIYNAVHIGSVNLLLNSGFTGDYKAEELNASYALDSGSELFSRGMKHWTGNAIINDDVVSVSGKCAVIGSLSQSVQLIKDERYVVSFKAKGSSVKVVVGGESAEQSLTSEYQRYSFKFVSDGIGSFSISGNATICDLQLERGTIATDWNPSPHDNNKTLAEFQALKYIQDAIREGDTSIIGGLILSSMIQLGNYKDGKMQKVNAGVNGIYNEDNDVAFWGGGTFEQAIRTIIKFKENPRYKPTESEWNNLSKYVVTHGGDIVLKGSVFADSGYFRGLVEIAEGKIRLSEDGSGLLASGGIRWDEKGILFRKWSDIIEWSGDLFNYQSGTYFDISTIFGQDPPTIELPNAPVHGYRICIALKTYIAYGSCKIVGKFSVLDAESNTRFVANTIQIYHQSSSEYWLTFNGSGFWTLETDTYAIAEGVVVLGMNPKTTVGGSVIDKESVSTSKLIAAESVTVTGESESSVTTYGGVWAVGSGHFGGSVSVGDRLEVTGTSVVGYLIATNIVAVGDIESYGEVKAKTFKTGDLVGKTEDVTIKATDGTHVLKFANGLYIGDSFTANS